MNSQKSNADNSASPSGIQKQIVAALFVKLNDTILTTPQEIIDRDAYRFAHCVAVCYVMSQIVAGERKPIADNYMIAFVDRCTKYLDALAAKAGKVRDE